MASREFDRPWHLSSVIFSLARLTKICAMALKVGVIYRHRCTPETAGYFGEQGLPVCLERFHRGCVDYLSQLFVPKWDSPNCEGESATARTASLLVELVGVAA